MLKQKNTFRYTILVITIFTISCSASKVENVNSNSSNFQNSVLKEEQNRANQYELAIPTSSLAQYNFLKGQLAISEEKYDDALVFLKEASELEKSPAPTLRKALSQLYLRMGKSDEALAEVEKALLTEPNDIELLQLKGGILATQHEVEKAVAVYKKIITLKPKSEDSYVFIASLYAQDRKFDLAKDILQKLIKANPTSFFGYYYFARMSEAKGDLADAETAYLKAWNINKEADAVALDLARVYGVQKKFKLAIEVCERIIKRDPKNVNARGLLGQLLLADNRVDKAIKELEQIGSLEEDATDTRLKIALLKVQKKDIEGAIVELNLVLSQHPENTTARYYLGTALAGLKRISDALSELAKIKENDPFYVESRIFSSYLLQQDKRYNEAISSLNQAINYKKNDVKLLLLLANLQHDAQDINSAIDTVKKMIELEPNDDKHYFLLGVYSDELGKKDEAIAAMRKAVELNSKNANALNYLGYSLSENPEHLLEAEKLVKAALVIEPENGYYLDSLAWIYYNQAKYKDALRQIEKAVKIVANDAVILEHHAMILIKLNKNPEALEIVNRAILAAPESDEKNIMERLKKLQDQLTK